MVKKKSFIKYIRFWTIVMFIVFGFIVVGINIGLDIAHFNQVSREMRLNYMVQQKQRIKQEIDRVIDMVYQERNRSKLHQKLHLVPHFNSEKNLKKRILERIGRIRFGAKAQNYVFVFSYAGIALMNDTQRHLIGKDTWSLADPNGVKVIQEQRKAVENPEGNYIIILGKNTQQNKCCPKLVLSEV